MLSRLDFRTVICYGVGGSVGQGAPPLVRFSRDPSHRCLRPDSGKNRNFKKIMSVPKRELDKVAAGLVNAEREILEAVVGYGIDWLDGLIRDGEKDDRVRLRALRLAKQFRDCEREQSAAGVDEEESESSGELRESVEADLAKLRGLTDKPAGESE